MYRILLYTRENGRSPVKEFTEDLAKKNKRAELTSLFAYEKRLQECGMQVNETYPGTMKHLRDGIYELRPGRNRVLFFSYINDSFVLLHVFKKATQKTPIHEIEKAKKEMNDFINRSDRNE